MKKQKQLAPNYKWKNGSNSNNYDKEINNIKINITNIKNDIENIDTILSSLQIQIDNNKNTEDEHYIYFNQEISDIDVRVTNNRQNIVDNTNLINAINKKIINIDNDINDITNRIDNITSEIPFLKWMVDDDFQLQNMDGTDFVQLFEIPYNFTNIWVISTKIVSTGNPVNMYANISDCGFTYNFINQDDKNYIQVTYTAENDKYNLVGNNNGFYVVYTQFLQN